ncbi:hypothetical protein EVAR_25577_1 [Eumeta japonica]|uniref:Uncharacterized protein n=1 Tax=Eumeta variegata TaxID=151549 RepID=A0A4C1V0P6_EUMVA|nr:hypothetical protein EVAR_25577_1 [Eumeta japonica]
MSSRGVQDGSRSPLILTDSFFDDGVRLQIGLSRYGIYMTGSGGARRRRPPTASRLKGPRKQKSFAYKLLKRGLANLMSPTSTSGVAPPLMTGNHDRDILRCYQTQRAIALFYLLMT